MKIALTILTATLILGIQTKVVDIQPETYGTPYVRQITQVPEPVTLTANVSAYNSDPSQTDGNPNITASGQRTREGIVACPSRLSFGTIVEIEGVEYECQDRMNTRYDCDRGGGCVEERFDIWMVGHAEAINWGVRKLEIKIKHL